MMIFFVHDILEVETLRKFFFLLYIDFSTNILFEFHVLFSTNLIINIFFFLATSGGFKGQKVMIVSSGANKVTNTASVSSPASSTIKIVQVGKQPQKQIAIMQQQPSLASKIMPTASPALTTVTASNDSGKISSTFSVSGGDSVISASAANTTPLNTKDNLKRKLELMEEELERDRLAMEGKMAKIRKLKAELIADAAPAEANDQYNLENNDDTDHT